MVRFEVSPRILKFLHNVQYVPTLGFNLISIGQLLSCGYLVLFDNEQCCISDKKTECVLTTIMMMKSQMFPLDVSQMEKFVLTAKEDDQSMPWHLHYGHLHLKGLKLLKDTDMVSGLPHIDAIKLC